MMTMEHISNNDGDYFSLDVVYKTALLGSDFVALERQPLEDRRFRKRIPGFLLNRFKFGLAFVAGDIVFFTFENGPVSFSFEGLCLSIRSRNFGRKQTSLITRNFIAGVGVEVTIAYFLRRIYKLGFSDYKRKQFFYNRPRLYYLRNRLNRETRIKS